MQADTYEADIHKPGSPHSNGQVYKVDRYLLAGMFSGFSRMMSLAFPFGHLLEGIHCPPHCAPFLPALR